MRKFTFFLLAFMLIISVFAFEGEKKVFYLDNGLTVILKETHISPMVSFQAWVRAGSITERDKMGSGLSHYFEHMLFKGTKKRKPGMVAQDIHKAGGSDFNAYTSFERTVYHFTILSKYTETGLDVLSDMLMNSVFDKKEAEKEQKVILKEINMNKDRPDSNLYWTMMSKAYTVFPYRHPVIGYEELFKKLTRQDVLNYYKTMYSPSNVILSIVGDFNMEEMLNGVKKYFGAWKRVPVPPIALPAEPRQVSFRYFEKEYDIKVSRMYMAYHTVSIHHKDLYALDVAASILGHGQVSRLYKRLVEKDKIAKSVYAYSWTPGYPGLFVINAKFDEKNFTKVKFAVLDEINRLKYEKVSKEELERVKNTVLASDVFGKEDIASQAESLANSYFYTGTINFDKKYIEGIKSVTCDDIIRVAKKYLNYDNLTLIHAKPRKEKTKINVSKNTKTDIKVEKIVLPNGLTVLLSKNDSLPVITVNAGYLAGVRVENEKNNGISNLASSLLFKGSKRFTKDYIEKEFALTGSKYWASSGNNTVFLGFKTLKDNFSKLWEIFADVLKNPKFSKTDFNIEKDKILNAIAQRNENIDSKNYDLYRSLMFKGHPYSMPSIGTKETVEKLKPEDIYEFYKKYMTAKNIVISIAGDFDVSKMKKIIEKSFSSLKKGERVKLSFNLKDIKNIRKIEHMKGKRQCIIRLGFRAPKYTDEDKYALNVLSGILSGLGSRLFENLRSKYSLAYTVYAYLFAGLDVGSYNFYIATIPQKREFAIKKMLEEIEKVKKEYVSDKELNIAKNKILGRHSLSLQNANDFTQDLVLNELYGLGYRETFEYVKKIEKITKKDIKKVANKYFNFDKKVIAITQP